MVFRKASPFPCFRIHVVDGLAELGILLAKRDGQAAAGAHGDVFVHGDAGEHLAPELGQIVVHDGDRGEAGVDHLEHVIVFEDVGGLVDHHGRLAARFQLLVQLGEALVIDARSCGRTPPGRPDRPPWRSAALPAR